MALLDDTNQRGDFNASGRGNRAAQGVDYFSNIVPGLQTIQDQLPVDAGFRDVQLPTFGDGGDRGPQGPGRDLKTDPLSGTEARALGYGQNMIGALPFGGLMNSAIDFNLGQMNADQKTSTEVGGETNRSSLGYYAGLAMGQGMTPTDAAKFAAETRMADMGRALGLARQDPNSVSVTDVNPDGTRTAVTTEVGAPIAPSTIQSTELGPLGGGGYDGRSRDYGGDRGPGGSSGDTAAAAAGASAAGPGMADGGPVGLSIPGYADGGPLLAMGFAGGGQIAGMGNPGGDVSPDMINMRVNQMIRNPQFAQMVAQSVQPLMQSGELTPQEVQMMGQIAEASLQNPKLYPQLRQFVAQQGMSPLPPAYDPTTITKILAVTRVLAQSGGGMAQPGQGQATPPGQIPPTDQAQMQNPNGMANGGFLQGPGTGRSDSIGTMNETTGQPVKVATGEYVIPEHVVKAKGRDFFDAMLRRYASVPKAGE